MPGFTHLQTAQPVTFGHHLLAYVEMDAGHESLLQAGLYIHTLEKRQGLKVACPEEIAFRQKWIDAPQVEKLAAAVGKSVYGDYLRNLLTELVF